MKLFCIGSCFIFGASFSRCFIQFFHTELAIIVKLVTGRVNFIFFLTCWCFLPKSVDMNSGYLLGFLYAFYGCFICTLFCILLRARLHRNLFYLLSLIHKSRGANAKYWENCKRLKALGPENKENIIVLHISAHEVLSNFTSKVF